MKSMLKAFSAVAISGAMVVPVLAGTDQKDLKKVIEDQGINYVQTAQKGITLSGYVDTSYTMQFSGTQQPYQQFGANNPVQTVSTPAGTTTTGVPQSGQTANGNQTAKLRQFDNNANGFNVNAVKLALEKALPDKNEWAAGFRVDLMAGSDANLLAASDPTLSGGSGVYVEQALVKFRVPVGNGLDIYMGKFVTFLGYEVIESPANLNFSRGLLFTNAIPLTHTGIYGDYKFNDTVEAKFGIVDGWNNSSSSATNGNFTSNNQFGGKAITGQVTINAPGKNANLTQSFIYSPQSSNDGVGGVQPGATVVYDIWGNWNPTFVKDNALLLGFNGDFGYQSSNATFGSAPESTNWYGVALYAQYKFTKVFSLAGRLEWLAENTAGGPGYIPKFQNTAINPGTGTPFASTTGGATNDYSATLTASFNIWENLLTRVEYRHDFLDNVGTSGQDEISLNAVYSF